MKLREIADIVDGKLLGDPDAEVNSVAPIDAAGEGVLTFAASKQYLRAVESSRATCIMVPRGFHLGGRNLIEVEDPRLALAKAMEVLYRPVSMPPGVEKGAHVAKTARLAPSSHVGALAYIGENARIGERTVVYPLVYIGPRVEIGDDCVIHPNAAIYSGVVLKKRIVVHANAVLGSDGFGYARDGTGHRKIPQVGTVVVEDDVEIGANAAIDRATMGETHIGRGTKIDNLVHIAHNVTVGENCLIVAQAGIAGSTEIGDSVIIGGQAGLVHHIKIGSRTVIGAQAGVTRSFPEDSTISGYPARDHNRSMRGYAGLSKLPSLIKKVSEMDRRLRELERKNGKA
ncbi:MAG: UDP-3-O-(3-hydroxymyristoyl)glucosamine N-acyltransferase [bacterium]